ncbi:transglutaminase domain-containing protein [Methanoregula sp.]|uniref:transglutaminase-like domain-containing protein n=1 Tax=Methanoregula sp. TaxID=2052170 RepID=UPI0023692DA9|nr:transglutaminase domain-containing protein [Methanoregula sp.]MDD1686392.1 transglutaminase domain-containing protein [Methanoregula sp.]
MKRILVITLLLVCLCVLLAGCTTAPVLVTASPGDTLLLSGEHEFQNNNLHAAERLFSLAQQNYTAAGNATAALHARYRATVAHQMTSEFPYNRSQIVSMIDTKFPGIPAERKASWLACNQSQCIESDGETWYFQSTGPNIQYHNLDIMRKTLLAINETPFYDQLTPYALAPAGQETGNYVHPVTWDGTETLSIPTGILPKSGTLRLWIPLPIETASQQNVTIVSIEPAAYVRSTTGTGADIGLAYLEIPLESVTGSFINVSAKFRFTAYEQRFVIDPDKVGSYNTSDPEYRKYTASGWNIAVTPALVETARGIVGNETNPYRKAQMIYRYVINRPYSLIPHDRLNAMGLPEADYILATGFGDCGTQSMYFAALCRAAGIPARATGGRQMVPGYGGDHFWSEYYLPGYGWIPNDVTVAEGAEWSYNATDAERQQYKQYYSENLDPYRYIIQRDADIPLVPDPGTATSHTGALQSPKIVCDTCTTDPELALSHDSWQVTLTKE